MTLAGEAKTSSKVSADVTVPHRSGDHLLAGRYEALLTQSRGVHVADIFRNHLRTAAQLRAATVLWQSGLAKNIEDLREPSVLEQCGFSTGMVESIRRSNHT